MRKALEKHANERYGFTLIELLLVIVIIGVLASLLLPTLSRAKGLAKRVACQSNLHQLGIAYILYGEDTGYYPGGIRLWTNGWIWPGLLLPYVNGDTKVYLCPARGPKYEWGPNITNRNSDVIFGIHLGGSSLPPFPYNIDSFTRFSYGANWYYGIDKLQTPKVGLPVRCVVAPSNLIAIGDGPGLGAAIGPLMGWWSFWGSPALGMVIGDPHQKGANAVFHDGHVEWKLKREWLSKDPEMRRRWCFDNQPYLLGGWRPIGGSPWAGSFPRSGSN